MPDVASQPDPPYPRVVGRRRDRLSPWVTVAAKDIEFAPGEAAQTYHCIEQADYVVVMAQRPDGTVAVVRQYRPAVEQFTLEFPAGLLEPGEDAADAIRRELREETGLETQEVVHLGSFFADTGRLANRAHAYFASAIGPAADFEPEPGIEVSFLTLDQLRELILAGAFHLQLHVAVLTLAQLKPPDSGT